MKDFLLSNYNLKVSTIYKKDGTIFFFVGNEKVIIVKSKEKKEYLNHLVFITNKLISEGLMVNTFLVTNKNEYCVLYKNEYIMLMKVNSVELDFTVKSIEKFDNYVVDIHPKNIINMWEEEVDLLEKELLEYNKEFPLIQESIDFFIGMAENAIQLLKEYESEILKLKKCICHRLNYKLFDNDVLYNPFYFITANKMYDYSNYIKYKFFLGEIYYNEIDIIIEKGNDIELIFLMGNLLYPSSYFNLVKKILLKEEKESLLSTYIKNISSYLKLLSYFKKCINNKSVKFINWISE